MLLKEWGLYCSLGVVYSVRPSVSLARERRACTTPSVSFSFTFPRVLGMFSWSIFTVSQGFLLVLSAFLFIPKKRIFSLVGLLTRSLPNNGY